MYGGATVGVVIPAYNEEAHVAGVIEAVPDFVDRTYVIDDASTDATWAVVQRTARHVNGTRPWRGRRRMPSPPPTIRATANRRAGSRTETVREDGGFDDRVVPIRHDCNRGVGAAIKTGYRRARTDGVDVAAVMAGDGQMDPAHLPRILDPIVSGGAGYAKGTRLLGPEYRRGMSNWRQFGNSLLTFLTKIASGYWGMTDPQNGYTAIDLDVFDDVDLAALYDDYGFLNDLLVRLNVEEIPIADVPVPSKYGSERSGIRYASFVPTLSWLLLRGFVSRIRSRYVGDDGAFTALAFLLGGLASVAGIVLLGSSLVGSSVGVSSRVPLTGTFGEVSVAGALLLAGLLLLLGALALDARHNAGLVTRTEAPTEGGEPP